MKLLRVCLSDSGKLPEILPVSSIEITPRRGNFRTATVLEGIERREDFFQVRDSGKGWTGEKEAVESRRC